VQLVGLYHVCVHEARFRKCKELVHLHCCHATKYCVLLTTM